MSDRLERALAELARLEEAKEVMLQDIETLAEQIAAAIREVAEAAQEEGAGE